MAPHNNKGVRCFKVVDQTNALTAKNHSSIVKCISSVVFSLLTGANVAVGQVQVGLLVWTEVCGLVAKTGNLVP